MKWWIFYVLKSLKWWWFHGAWVSKPHCVSSIWASQHWQSDFSKAWGTNKWTEVLMYSTRMTLWNIRVSDRCWTRRHVHAMVLQTWNSCAASLHHRNPLLLVAGNKETKECLRMAQGSSGDMKFFWSQVVTSKLYWKLPWCILLKCLFLWSGTGPCEHSAKYQRSWSHRITWN